MKKIVIALMMLSSFAAYAENENAATSKEYVDAELATKQPTIPAEGANIVMTFDSTADEGIGTKNIYDESASYASQTDALVTAETANAAVQMAIQGEFYCKEYSTIDPTDCWLWGINPITHDGEITPDNAILVRAYFKETISPYWRYYPDASTSVRVPIKPNARYKLWWDSGYNIGATFRVAFTKSDDIPDPDNQMVSLCKSDGTDGYELLSAVSETRSYTFTVSDNDIKYIVVQIPGSNWWDTGNFQPAWDRISHLHLNVESYLPENQ